MSFQCPISLTTILRSKQGMLFSGRHVNFHSRNPSLAHTPLPRSRRTLCWPILQLFRLTLTLSSRIRSEYRTIQSRRTATTSPPDHNDTALSWCEPIAHLEPRSVIHPQMTKNDTDKSKFSPKQHHDFRISAHQP
jgi:hypothetical protein